MNKILTNSTLLLCFLYSFSQKGNVTVNYTLFIDDDIEDVFAGSDFKNATLVTNGKNSLYIEKRVDTTIVFSSGNEYVSEADFTYYYSKDLPNKTIINKDRYVGMKYVVKDANYAINWTITENAKKIMGYNCHEATGNYRGRGYKAYFLKDIPHPDGPYKFDGLPGLILEVLSDDGKVKITATGISVDADLITNPYKDETTFITYEESAKKYQVMFDKVLNYKQDENTSSNIPKRYMECYVK